MKISKTELKLILIFSGLIVFIALYIWIYIPMLDTNDDLQAEINELKPQLEQLIQHELNYDSYVASIEETRANIATQLVAHPSKIESEEFLKWAIDWQSDNGLDISSVSFGATSSLAQFPLYVDTGTEAQTDTAVTVNAGSVSLTASAQFSYAEIKRAINDIYNYPQSTALENLTLTYNVETGELLGNISVIKYFIDYPGAPYSKVPMPSVPVGNQNPFGAIG